MKYRLADAVEFNPTERLPKGTVAKKVGMDKLAPFTRDIPSWEVAPYGGGAKFRNSDTIMARITPCLENGKIAQVNILDEGEVGYGSTEFIVWRARDGVTDKDYVYYLSQSPEIRDVAVKSMVGSSGRQRVQQTVLDNFVIDLPSLTEQIEIGRTLAALDAKIAANTAVNHNLEQTARAVFKSWFIDFEPWGGVMPDDWRDATFNDIIEATLGGDWGKDAPMGNNTQEVYCIRGADITDVNAGNKGKMPIRYILPKNYASKRLADGDIVVEISGGSPTQSTGRCALITESLLNRYDRGMVCTNFCRAVKPKAGYSAFTYFYWRYLYDQAVMFSYENGTTGIKNLDISGFLEIEPILIPPLALVQRFSEAIGKFVDMIFANGLDSETLAQTRDTLLPRLMSGELSVTDG